MKKVIFSTFVILTFCIFTFGQNSNCPTISVTGPMKPVQPDGEIDFTATVSGIDTSKVGYKWTVSEGTITQGQGTPRISVSVKKLFDNAITATAEFLNLPEGCPNTESETDVMACRCTLFVLDEFGNIPLSEQRASLAVIKDELEKNNDYIAYIILYPSSKNKKKLEKRTAFIELFLAKDKKIPKEKFLIAVGDEEIEERTRIYLIPAGAEPPTP